MDDGNGVVSACGGLGGAAFREPPRIDNLLRNRFARRPEFPTEGGSTFRSSGSGVLDWWSLWRGALICCESYW